jgi:hypothetical protein
MGHVLKQIGEALGVVAGAVGAVYLLGALVMTLRLQTNDLPTLAVVSNLPRELLISYGLTYAVAPWLVTSAIVATYWLLRKGAPGEPHSSGAGWSRGQFLAIVVLALAAAVVLGVGLTLHELGGTFTVWDALAVAVSIAVVAVLGFLVWGAASRHYRAASRPYGKRWSTVTATLVASGLSGLVAIPAFVDLGARVPLAKAQLCVEGPTHLRGLLIGEVADRVYIGEDSDPHRLVSSSRTGELYIGPDATEPLLCRDERRLKPTADQLVEAALKAEDCKPCSGRVDRIRVSGTQPWFASAFVEAQPKQGSVAPGHFVFRRAEPGWRVVAKVPNLTVDCDILAAQTGVTHDILRDGLAVCEVKA